MKKQRKKALFLDRDGVLNEEKKGSYIFTVNEFKFLPEVLPALKKATGIFDYVFIVTNQRGIGRGYMTENQLLEIHQHLVEKVEENGGKIDKIYFAPNIEDNHPNRKPNTGMGLQASEDFPDFEFSQSVMVGNNLSDMGFGKRLGMKTIFLHTTQEPIGLPHYLIDEQHASLYDWIKGL